VAADLKGFPFLFPFVTLELEDPFNAFSFHENNANGNKYYASAFVDDPDQATYSSVSCQ